MVQKKQAPLKKSDKELLALIEDKIEDEDYIFLPHAKKRQKIEI